MYSADGKYYQRRHQLDRNGKEINVVQSEIDYVVGSGNHARNYLHRTSEGRLLELPVAWYAEKGGYWAMNPGFDNSRHFDFRRQISYECVFCHTGYPEIPAGRGGGDDEPLFPGRIPEGIDCQRCHGPGRNHIQAAAGGNRDDIRAAIVNPSRISPERRLEVCMQCHLESTSSRLPARILRVDRSAFSYRPGDRLADFVMHFDHQPGTGHDDKFEIAHQAYRFRMSACFQKSEGRLTCTTCHNPHAALRGDEAAKHYSSVCLGCHAQRLEQLVAARRHTAATRCVECHMPKRRTEDVVHVVMTDHYIQRQKPARDLLAPLSERRETAENSYRGEVALYYPTELPDGADKDLYFAVAQVSQQANLDKGTEELARAIEKHQPARIEFYLHLADAWKDRGQLDKALPLYQDAVRRDPKSAIALQRFGFALRSAGEATKAGEILKQALAVNSGDAASWHQLGLVYLDQGSRTDAVTAFQKALELDRDLFEAYNSLGGVWLEGRELAKAEQSFREAIKIRPDYAEAHSNLAGALASMSRFDEALYHFRYAIRLKPDFPAALFNYGVALSKMNRLEEARRQIELALKYNPRFEPALNALRILNQSR